MADDEDERPNALRWGKDPILNGKNKIIYHEVRADDLADGGVIEIELELIEPPKPKYIGGLEHIGDVLKHMAGMVEEHDEFWVEPKTAHYYGERCGPWLARMQIEMASGDYYFFVDNNQVSKLSAKCVVEYWGKRAKDETGELGIFKKHRKWLMEEYGIYCPRFAGRLDGREEG